MINFEEQQDISTLEDESLILVTESYSSNLPETKNMPTNPFKKLRQSLLAKEKNRKNGMKRFAKKLKFWKKDEKKDKDTLVDEDNESTSSR